MKSVALKNDEALLQEWGNFVCESIDLFANRWPGMTFLFGLELQDGTIGHIVVQTCWFRHEPAFRVIDSSFALITARPDLYLRYEWGDQPPTDRFRMRELNDYVHEVLTAITWAVEEYRRNAVNARRAPPKVGKLAAKQPPASAAPAEEKVPAVQTAVATALVAAGVTSEASAQPPLGAVETSGEAAVPAKQRAPKPHGKKARKLAALGQAAAPAADTTGEQIH